MHFRMAGVDGRGDDNVVEQYLRRMIRRAAGDECAGGAHVGDAGLEQVQADWLSHRLSELGEMWRVDGDGNFRDAQLTWPCNWHVIGCGTRSSWVGGDVASCVLVPCRVLGAGEEF